MLDIPASWFRQPVDVATLAFPFAFKHEEDSYLHLQKMGQGAGCFCRRIETTRQMGFPDLMFVYKSYHLLMEVKYTSKTSLQPSITKALTWQFGQVGFAQRMFEVGSSYALAVVHHNFIELIYPANGKKYCNRIVHMLLDVAARRGHLSC